MPSVARPRRVQPVKKQNRYRISDDDDDDNVDGVASEASYSNAGGVLASLNRNLPIQRTTKRTTAAAVKTKHNKQVKPSIEFENSSPNLKPRNSSTPTDCTPSGEQKPPLSSVVVKTSKGNISPLSSSRGKTGSQQRSYRRRLSYDEISAISCGVQSPHEENHRAPKGNSSVNKPHASMEGGKDFNRLESQQDPSDGGGDLTPTLDVERSDSEGESSHSLDDGTDQHSIDSPGEEESNASASYSNDDTALLVDGEIRGDHEHANEEEDDEDVDEVESDEEFEFEDEEFIPDDDSDADDDEVSVDLDDFVVEETPPKKRNRPQRKVTTTPAFTCEHLENKCPQGIHNLSCIPKSNQRVSQSPKQMQSDKTPQKSIENATLQNSFHASPPASEKSRPKPSIPNEQADEHSPQKFDDDATEIEETPAKFRYPGEELNICSPEPQMAMIVADDSDVDDGLVVTIVEDSSESFLTRDALTSEMEGGVQQMSLSHKSWMNSQNRVATESVVPIDIKVVHKNHDDDITLTSKSAKIGINRPVTQTTFFDGNEPIHLQGNPKCDFVLATKGSTNDSTKDRQYRREGTVKRGKWILGARIGVGSFGEVHVGMNTQTGVLMAVKRFRMEGAIMKDIRTEVELLRSLKHKNIVRYFGAQMDRTYLHIFQEWVPGGSVSSLLSKFGPFSLEVIQSYLSQTLSGLQYLHKVNIMHRDLKGSNILVNDEGVVKLADFGASKRLAHLEDDLMMSLTVRGTPYFMAPEVFEEKYSAKADIWGIGCVAFQMATSRPPWKDEGFTNPISLFNHIKKQKRGPSMQHPESDSFSNREQTTWNLFEEMVRKCFCPDPMMRPTTFQLLSDPFFLTVHEGDEESVHRGLFSPGNESKSSCEFFQQSPQSSMSACDPRVPSADSFSPSAKVTRSKSVVQWKTTFLSPPRAKTKQITNSPVPTIASSHTPSKSPDTSEWPDWARAQLKMKNISNERSSKKVVADLTNLMGSFALSEDSGNAETSRENIFNRSSTLATTTAQSKLVGLSFLDKSSCPTYEI